MSQVFWVVSQRNSTLFTRTRGLCSWCTATEPRQLDNPHNPLLCTGGAECLILTPDSHSVCAVRTPIGVNRSAGLFHFPLFASKTSTLSLFQSEARVLSIYYSFFHTLEPQKMLYIENAQTNEIVRSVIITQHFPYTCKICSPPFDYLCFLANCLQNV